MSLSCILTAHHCYSNCNGCNQPRWFYWNGADSLQWLSPTGMYTYNNVANYSKLLETVLSSYSGKSASILLTSACSITTFAFHCSFKFVQLFQLLFLSFEFPPKSPNPQGILARHSFCHWPSCHILCIVPPHFPEHAAFDHLEDQKLFQLLM